MEMLLFFIVIPAVSGTLQFFLTRSQVSRRVKWYPAAATAGVMLVCFLGVIGWISLPETYFFSEPTFVRFPDFFVVWLCCFPTLFGLGMGAFLACSDFPS